MYHSDMAWTDLISDAQYTSPSGRVFTFCYGDLKKETDLKTATFTFPEADGALVVPLGVGGRRFPLNCHFYGPDCLGLADGFEAALEERGYGELTHPVYGVRKVIPTGTIARSDNLVSALNVSAVDVVFAETIIDEMFPASDLITEDEIGAAVDKFADAATAEFAADMDPADVAASIRAQQVVKEQATILVDDLSPVAKKSVSSWAKFQEVAENLEQNIAKFAEEKTAIARQIIAAGRIPSRLAVSVLAKIEGYGAAINAILTNYKKDPVGIENVKNQFVASRLTLQTLMTNLAAGIALTMHGSGQIDSPAAASSAGVVTVSGGSAGFRSRDAAINTAVQLAELYDDIVAFCDIQIKKDMFVDTGAGFAAMRDVVISAITMITDSAFPLPGRKIIILGRDRQIMELLAELYGNFDKIDEFIVDNDLTANEIAMIPMGRQVAYYV